MSDPLNDEQLIGVIGLLSLFVKLEGCFGLISHGATAVSRAGG